MGENEAEDLMVVLSEDDLAHGRTDQSMRRYRENAAAILAAGFRRNDSGGPSEAQIDLAPVVEYGITYTDPTRPVTFRDNMEEAQESQKYYNHIGEGKYRSLILQRTKGVAPGPWGPIQREGGA